MAIHPAKSHAGSGEAVPTASRRRRDRELDRDLLVGSVAYALHGLFFLLLVVGALIEFGAVFDVLGAVVAVIALSSLQHAWTGFRAWLDGEADRAQMTAI